MPLRKNILLVSYYFPPLGMGGVGRPYSLFKYLPDYGYDVTVLTVKTILYPEYDHSLLAGVDKAKIARTGSFDPARLLYLVGLRNKKALESSLLRKGGWLYFPDSKRGWNLLATPRAKNIIKQKNIAAVITTTPPPSSHLIGMKLKKQLGVAWIADFRDLWFSLPIEMVYRNQRNRSYALDLRKKIVETADEVVSVNNDIRRYLGRGEIIMNGADIDSSKYWQNAPNHQKDILKIGILGTANHLCPIEPLFRAVKLLLARNPSLKSRLSIIHIGHYDHKILAGILEAGLNDIVTMKGYLPKNEAIRSLAAVDLLYLGVDKFGDYNILPGRIFDYLISGKLILGVLPNDSEAAALLKEYGNSAIFSKENIEEISVYLAGLLCSGDKKNKTERLDTLDLGKYSSLATAQKYAALLDRLLK